MGASRGRLVGFGTGGGADRKWLYPTTGPANHVSTWLRRPVLPPGFFCKKVVEEAARYFVEKRPAVEFIHFSDPDERGHAIGWMSDPQTPLRRLMEGRPVREAFEAVAPD